MQSVKGSVEAVVRKFATYQFKEDVACCRAHRYSSDEIGRWSVTTWCKAGW